MKKKVVTLAAILFAGTISSTALAQYVPGCNSGMTQNELTNFNGFLHRHPKDAQDLAANPRLANNPRFLANHLAMKEFLANHPGVRHGLHASPGQFMNSAGKYQWMSPLRWMGDCAGCRSASGDSMARSRRVVGEPHGSSVREYRSISRTAS